MSDGVAGQNVGALGNSGKNTGAGGLAAAGTQYTDILDDRSPKSTTLAETPVGFTRGDVGSRRPS